jgi:hypothetical protein
LSKLSGLELVAWGSEHQPWFPSAPHAEYRGTATCSQYLRQRQRSTLPAESPGQR